MRYGDKIKLIDWSTIVEPFCASKKDIGFWENTSEKLISLRRLHYASNRYALLLNFQGVSPIIRNALG